MTRPKTPYCITRLHWLIIKQCHPDTNKAYICSGASSHKSAEHCQQCKCITQSTLRSKQDLLPLKERYSFKQSQELVKLTEKHVLLKQVTVMWSSPNQSNLTTQTRTTHKTKQSIMKLPETQAQTHVVRRTRVKCVLL